VIGAVDNGTYVFPVSVERKNVSPARVALSGRVLDEQGQPVVGAIVERSPNRYVADDWNIVPADEGLPGDYQESYFDGKMMSDSPLLTYRAIHPENGHPTVTTDQQGRFQFEGVKLGETVLTVEAEGFAPQHRHINHVPDTKPSEFQLEPGRGVHGRVVDPKGQPVAGACVVLGLWHCHTDERGRFDWSVKASVPTEVPVKVYKRYSGQHAVVQQSMALSEIEQHPIVLETR
jgi:protocatechuate 3,4-dioxygenase beta subunit